MRALARVPASARARRVARRVHRPRGRRRRARDDARRRAVGLGGGRDRSEPNDPRLSLSSRRLRDHPRRPEPGRRRSRARRRGPLARRGSCILHASRRAAADRGRVDRRRVRREGHALPVGGDGRGVPSRGVGPRGRPLRARRDGPRHGRRAPRRRQPDRVRTILPATSPSGSRARRRARAERASCSAVRSAASSPPSSASGRGRTPTRPATIPRSAAVARTTVAGNDALTEV